MENDDNDQTTYTTCISGGKSYGLGGIFLKIITIIGLKIKKQEVELNLYQVAGTKIYLELTSRAYCKTLTEKKTLRIATDIV